MKDVPEEQRHSRRDGPPDGIDDLDRKPDAVLEAASILVRALVRDGAQELADKVPVRAMNLNHVEPSLDRTLRGISKRRDDLLDPLLRQLLRDDPPVRERDRARAVHLVRPAALVLERGRAHVDEGRERGRLAAGVRELDRDLLVLGVRELDDLGPRGRLLVRPDSSIFWGDAAFGEDGARFDYGQTGSASEDPTD